MSNRYESGSPVTCSGEEVTPDLVQMDYAIIDFRCSDKKLKMLFDLVRVSCYHYIKVRSPRRTVRSAAV